MIVEGDIRDVLVAQGGRHAAFTEVLSAPGLPTSSHRLGLIALEGEPRVSWLDDIAEPILLFGESAHQFSADGAMLAVLSHPPDRETLAVHVVDVRALAVRTVAENVAPESLRWVDRRLLVRSRDRSDWWLAWDRDNTATCGVQARNVTGALPAAPGTIIHGGVDERILVIAEGELWSIPSSGAEPMLLTGEIGERITTRVPQAPASRPSRRFVVTARDGSRRSFYHVDASQPSALITPIAVPAGASIAAYDPALERFLAWAPSDANGSFLWTGTVHGGVTRRLLALNEHLAEVAPHRRLLVDYAGEDGQALQAVVMLPPQNDATRPPPAVFWVYPGYEVRDTVQYWLTLNHAHTDNLNVLAGAGYAVVIPSMPLGAPPRENLLEQTTAGVLPLFDRLGDLELVDTARVAVVGQSFGGYGVLALISMTDRFRTAVAMDAFANLTSLFGTFDARERYTATPHMDPNQARYLTGAGFAIGATPWEEPERYWRNSPLAYVSAVETPLLLIQGDLDYVPIQQSEEYFTALQWLGKPARFVRYWGESHGVNSAANIRDRWSRVIEWLEQTLPATAEP